MEKVNFGFCLYHDKSDQKTIKYFFYNFLKFYSLKVAYIIVIKNKKIREPKLPSYSRLASLLSIHWWISNADQAIRFCDIFTLLGKLGS